MSEIQRVAETSSNLDILKHAITINQIIARFRDSAISVNHADLSGLDGNDHPQYGLIDKGSTQTWQQYQVFEDGISVGYGYADIYNTGAAQVALWMYNDSFAANQKYWSFTINADGSNMSWNIFGDAPGYTERKIISVDRTALAITGIAYGNTTDVPDHTFYGSLIVTGHAYPYLSVTAEGVDAYPWLEMTKYSGAGDTGNDYGGGFILRQALGTAASPTATASGTAVGEFLWQARGTSSWLSTASLRYVTDGAAGATVTGKVALLVHTGAGFTDETYARMSWYNTGEVALGTDGWVTFDEHASAPGTPSSGRVALYAKADGLLYSKDDAGLERRVSGQEIVRGAAFVSASALTTSVAPVVLHFNKAVTITKVVLIGNTAGTCEIAIKKVARSSYLGDTSGSSIVASDPPTTSSQASVEKTTFTGWTTSINADDVIIVSLTSVSTFSRLTVLIYCEE